VGLYRYSLFSRLRQVDVKAEHFERQVQRVEQEREEWEKKYEDAQERYQASKRELDEVVQQMESL
jgi:tropomyosin